MDRLQSEFDIREWDDVNSNLDESLRLSDAKLRQLSEDLYVILVDKSTGEAASRISAVDPGDGFKALLRLYLWYAAITVLALTSETE